MAMKALSGSKSTGSKVDGLPGYRISKRNYNDTTKKKLIALKGLCSKCNTKIFLYAEYSNSKTNKDPHKFCKPCFKAPKQKGKETNKNGDEA